MYSFRNVIFLLILLSACARDEDIGAVSYARIQTEVPKIYLGSGNSLQLKAHAYDDEDELVIISGWQYYANGEKVTSKFKPAVPGQYKVWARKASIYTDTISVEALPVKTYDWIDLNVIFHVVNLPDIDITQIDESFAHANKAFSNQLGSKNPNAQSAFIRITAAAQTPGGESLSRPGVVIEQNLPDSITPREFANIVLARQWNPDQYVNVWVTPVYPNAYSDFGRLDCGKEIPGLQCLDELETKVRSGIYLMASQIGSESDTFIHELGHLMGLLHVFTKYCDADADFCEDTPVYIYDKYVNKPPSRTCDYQFFTQDNHMDYTDAPSFSFTYDQVERMRYVLTYGRYVGNRRGLMY